MTKVFKCIYYFFFFFSIFFTALKVRKRELIVKSVIALWVIGGLNFLIQDFIYFFNDILPSLRYFIEFQFRAFFIPIGWIIILIAGILLFYLGMNMTGKQLKLGGLSKAGLTLFFGALIVWIIQLFGIYPSLVYLLFIGQVVMGIGLILFLIGFFLLE